MYLYFRRASNLLSNHDICIFYTTKSTDASTVQRCYAILPLVKKKSNAGMQNL